MDIKKGLLALLASAMLIPAGAAELTFTQDNTDLELTPGSANTIAFTAHKPCTDFIGPGTAEGLGSVDHTVSVTLPDGYTGDSSVDLTFSGQGCLSGASDIEVSGSISVTPGATAPGMAAATAGLASDDGGQGSLAWINGYRKGYEFVVGDDLPTEVNAGETATWTVTLQITANANTMAMTQLKEKTQCGTLTGLFPFLNFRDLTAEQLENGIMHPIEFSYTPTATTSCTEDSVQFITWSHYLEDGTMKTDNEEINWNFTINGAVEEEGGKGIPGVGAPIMGLAILAAAAVVLRRNE